MRKIMIVFGLGAIVTLSNCLFANAGIFAGLGQSIELTKTEQIQMVSEDITIIPGRGKSLFKGDLSGMDIVDYLCKFKLKNITNTTVNVQIGFPLNADSLKWRNKENTKTSEMVAEYKFIAQEEGHIYNVRYVPGDIRKKLKHLFLWDMKFLPNEEKELLISYSMHISCAAAIPFKTYMSYEKEWYGKLECCLLEWFGYVTETAKSWAGPVGKANFKVYIKGFDEYINRRPLYEDLTLDEFIRQDRRNFPVYNPLIFRMTEPTKWQTDKQGFLTLTYKDYKADENLMFYYYILPFPRNIADVERLMKNLTKSYNLKIKDIIFTKADYEDLRDIFLEFNGKKTGNKRIQKFVENQKWYGQEKQMLIPAEVIKFIDDKIK